MSINTEKAKQIAKEKGAITIALLQKELAPITRQGVYGIVKKLVDEGVVIKQGTNRKHVYITPEHAQATSDIVIATFHRTYQTQNIEEHTVYEEVQRGLPSLLFLPKETQKILEYAFGEMCNNAIDHSQSGTVEILVELRREDVRVSIRDRGIGVFKNIQNYKGLTTEREAIQDLLTGKLTTAKDRHSGEGIFFTSKAVDKFTLQGGHSKLLIDNVQDDTFVLTVPKAMQGTLVDMVVPKTTKQTLSDVFRTYTNVDKESDHGFDVTEKRISLYQIGGNNLSRSEAKRVLSGLEKFKVAIFDFKGVESVGQAFADEIFRVYWQTRPEMSMVVEHANEDVWFMIARVEHKKPERK